MAPYSSAQKQSIAHFVTITNEDAKVAVKYLRSNDWSVEHAVDAYYRGGQGTSVSVSSLNKIFDSYRDTPEDNPDTMGIDGTMKFFGDIQVQLDEVACFGVAELLKSPSMGEFTREGFVNGWKSVGCDSLDKMIAYGKKLRDEIPTKPDVFRRVYRYAFPLCRLQGQRNLNFDIATEQWRLFFTSENGGISWNTPTTPWLDWYLQFLEERGKRPVNKDLWEQTLEFMRKTHEDENFGWWSADGAWPGTLDDFVEWVQSKREGKSAAGGEAMEVE